MSSLVPLSCTRCCTDALPPKRAAAETLRCTVAGLPASCPHPRPVHACALTMHRQTHTHTRCAGRLPQLPRSPAWSKHRPPACASHSNHPIHLQCTGPPGFWLPTPVRSGQSPGGSKSCSDVVSSSDPQGITLTDALSRCHFSSRF